ncbi:hypothetical protein WN944_023730 [Citrus x changshan-huyou]|uniref:Uncharacterized protein n=1 Tax=Citrus x changshan-huyou TaxID=2935761 RepID=A0AAP0LM52_9ROSI
MLPQSLYRRCMYHIEILKSFTSAAALWSKACLVNYVTEVEFFRWGLCMDIDSNISLFQLYAAYRMTKMMMSMMLEMPVAAKSKKYAI